MSSMADEGNNKDALLEKLDGLIQSGRVRKRRDPPPVLTDAIPDASGSDIPTLTDAVEIPDTRTKQPAEEHSEEQSKPQTEQQAEQSSASAAVDLGTPLEFEPVLSTETEPPVPAGLDRGAPDEPDTTPEHQQEQPDDAAPDAPADLQESISSRLVSVIDREMTALTDEIPTHKGKLATLQRSLRFALPELVRLRLQEEPAGKPIDDSDDSTQAGS